MLCLRKSEDGAGILTDYCARVLDPAKKAEVDRHVEVCAECRGLLERQNRLWQTLDQWTAPEVSPNFDARLYARIAREEAAPRWKQWAWRILRPPVPVAMWKPVVSLAAACAVVAIALTVHTPQPQPAAPQMHAEQVDIEQVSRALDDLDILAPSNPM